MTWHPLSEVGGNFDCSSAFFDDCNNIALIFLSSQVRITQNDESSFPYLIYFHFFSLSLINLEGVGFGQCICTIIVLSIYSSVMALTIRYFLASFGDPLPWSQCSDAWNTTCIDSVLKVGEFARNATNAMTSAELFFV
jgi:hypothetical protein